MISGNSEAVLYPLEELYFYLFPGCNLHCRHCWIISRYRNLPQPPRALNFELFSSIIEQAQALGLAGVKLTGGEPLLHPQIMDILHLVRDKKLALSLETNGVCLTREICAAIAQCEQPFVSVSLDGVEAETHEWLRQTKGCFHASLEGIERLREAGVAPQIIMCLMRRNGNQMERMARLAESLRAESLKFNILQPIAQGEQLVAEDEAFAIEELVSLGRYVEEELAESVSLKVCFDHPPAFRPLSKLLEKNSGRGNSCGILSILGVLADGSYALCGVGELIPELVFGRAPQDSLERVWREAPVLQTLRRDLPSRLEGVCRECLMKGMCLGSCVAQNYYRSRNLWAPFWYCEAAFKAGLFPGSRLRAGEDPEIRIGVRR